MKNVVLGSVLAATHLLLHGCGGGSDDDGATKTIVELANGTEELSTLVAAVQAADLVKTLSGTGPFTVFAPTDDAFKKLPPTTLSCLLKPVGFQTLQDLLKYHVVSGSTLAKDLTKDQNLTTLDNNLTLTVKKSGDNVTVNAANVTKADLSASNGVVHEIDEVLIPDGFDAPSCGTMTVADLANSTDALSSLFAALKAADLVKVFNGTDLFTVFAPTDKAFSDALNKSELECLLSDASRDLLVGLLKYHVVSGYKLAKDLVNGTKLTTIDDNATLAVTIDAQGDFVNKANITEANQYATNGVVHVIDQVLLPDGFAPPTCGTPSSIQV